MSYYPPMQSPFMAQLMPQSTIIPQMPTQEQEIQFVNGRAGCDAFQMLPNKKAWLMDSNLPRFYIKQTDANGQATVKSYDFTETEEEKPKEYVTKEEFETFKSTLKGVKHESNNESSRKQ